MTHCVLMGHGAESLGRLVPVTQCLHF